jgi:hypothetical protein
MLESVRTRNSTPASQRLLAHWPASHHPSLVTHHCLNQSLAKHNRKSSQIIENNRQRPKSIASFCRVFLDCTCRGPSVSHHPDERVRMFKVPTRSPLSLSNRKLALLESSLTHRKQTPTLRSDRKKMQGWRESHDNIKVRLLLLDTPSGTACTGFDQGCKDRARKPFLAVIQ